ncbi:hypothetical protein [uncultured Pseudacidovorax sp.]|uniref:hypothetical protein n=1 Tax=uncultured Pseudacidovorax sp. TaxID=679313 RepID=UPI0025D02B17|nr:hypothetical protein [uncultured Pseudacidovorax sp.]
MTPLLRSALALTALATAAGLLAGCDPKPKAEATAPAPAAAAPAATSSAASGTPEGITPAPSHAGVDSGAHKGPAEGSSAIGGVAAGQAAGGHTVDGPTPAPSAGDGAAPKN